jgi:NAD(P)-dependent dehydrogenase (short-subunit alcohol dehydrogenase family)
MGSAVEPGYCAAKAGLLGLTRSLARAVARKGVTVNLVVPGDHQARHRVAWPQFSAPSPVISERPGRPAGADSDCGPAAGAAPPQSIGRWQHLGMPTGHGLTSPVPRRRAAIRLFTPLRDSDQRHSVYTPETMMSSAVTSTPVIKTVGGSEPSPTL